jgi:hypothetical protein
MGLLKQFRRVATRYDSTAASVLGFVQIAAINSWMRFVYAFHERWAVIPRDRGHSFHGISGSHSTRWWAADLTDGFME